MDRDTKLALGLGLGTAVAGGIVAYLLLSRQPTTSVKTAYITVSTPPSTVKTVYKTVYRYLGPYPV